jgi:NAD(P)-dependent dehydrogenase (short-subunit alcohol dehydrogenase family)
VALGQRQLAPGRVVVAPAASGSTSGVRAQPLDGQGLSGTPGIRVSTPMNEDEPEGGVVPLTPLGRRAHVSEISGAVAYLASDDASFVTGTELVIDGGYLAR